MRTDLLLSFLLHFVFILALVVSAPFQPRVRTDFGEVITVNITSLPASLQPKQLEPISIPRAIEAEEPIAEIAEVTPVIEPRPKSKATPKPKKDKIYKPQAEKGPAEREGLTNGQRDVSENLGADSRFGGAAVDNASFSYPYWFVQTFGKIERNWTNPVFANQPLSCTIYFQVITSGRIIKIEIEKRSGVDAYDRACERAVKQSQPLPPLPDEFTDEILGIHLEFPYLPL
ncbi:MAG: TonB family protein [Candidatus Zixiibacteriota bacterium]|nr:MAG: TonB family protein [candidate division Zixibacteria bacterium]